MWYVGIINDKRTLFKHESEPTDRSHGDKFDYAVGPFVTKRAAQWFVSHRGVNSVAEAEKAVRRAK